MIHRIVEYRRETDCVWVEERVVRRVNLFVITSTEEKRGREKVRMRFD